MKRLAWCMVGLMGVVGGLAPALPAGAQQQPPVLEGETVDLEMVVREQRLIPAAGVEKFSLATVGARGEDLPDPVRVKVDGEQLLVTALRPGQTTLLLLSHHGQKTWRITVNPRAPKEIREELQRLLSGLTGVEVRQLHGRIVLDGGVPAVEDLDRIKKIIELYPEQVTSLVTVDPARQKTNIKLDFHFVQFRRNASHQVGLSWPGRFSLHSDSTDLGSNFLFTVPFGLGAGTGQITITENLLPSLDLLGMRGWAKVNSAVSVVTTNGGTGSYQSGGEVNVKIATSLGQSSLQKVPFGVRLTVQPRLDQASDLIGITIDAEQSQLTPIAGQDVPGRTLTLTKTTVHVKLGQSIVLSGFKEHSESLHGSGIPGLMRIPIIGYLFRTEGGMTDEVENVLFITPTLIAHTSPDNVRRIHDAVEKYAGWGGHIVY